MTVAAAAASNPAVAIDARVKRRLGREIRLALMGLTGGEGTALADGRIASALAWRVRRRASMSSSSVMFAASS
jgi:hypothetical protein